MNAVRTGRKPAGPQIVKRLEGSPTAKRRLEVILETITGQLTVSKACQQLGVGKSRFHALRSQTLQATLETLEPRPAGRPAKPISPEQTEVDELEAKLCRLHAELELAQVQLRLAHIHPALVGIHAAADNPASKKNSRSTCQQCQQRWSQRRRRKAK
jgi:transposase-like protein